MRTIILAVLIALQCPILLAEDLRIGTTFSPVQSKYLDMDWKETYLSILDSGFDLIRLGAYWKEIEKEEDVYDFSDLDWQVREARKKGIPVILTVGMKAPRWPEYFIPEWVAEKISLRFGADVSENGYLRERTLKFIRKVVNHYNEEPIIRCWQVENEPLNRMGEKYWIIGKDFLEEEVRLARKLDAAKRPVLLTAATYPNKFLRFARRFTVKDDPIVGCLELCDIMGLNVYPVVGQKFWALEFYVRTGRKEREAYFSRLLKMVKDKNKEAWIVEFQAEPWEPGELVYKEKEPPPTGRPDLFRQNIEEFKKLGFDTILLWGAEYWLYREKRHGITTWSDVVNDLLRTK
ncbi:MAG: beta-galactosidase [Candidatus Omnitrophota bacterium]|jgi:hypothetical protein